MEFIDWGLIHYPEATERQLELVEKVASGEVDDTVIFCTHPPVVTLGRSTHPEDVQGWTGDVFESSRGGRATYHGPEQLVIYPILDLKKERKNLRPRDVHQYLRVLEQAIVRTLEELNIAAEVRETKSTDPEGRELIFTGVWSGNHKIASIGIAVRKWVTYHGAAINLTSSLNAFSGIQPCGFTKETMISIEELALRSPDSSHIQSILEKQIRRSFI
ncbi:MAG: lipoyl(octanoyl) transferase LipB [Bdellovibrionales bacterium]|nr:lipoyl(octanoyl) transferase LipB [Bdellovibrionales bacterium]